MKRRALWFVAGLLCGLAVSVSAAKLVGGTGYLTGWTVTVDGEDVCSDPYVWEGINEIECD